MYININASFPVGLEVGQIQELREHNFYSSIIQIFNDLTYFALM